MKSIFHRRLALLAAAFAVGLLTPALSHSAEPPSKPLKDLPLDLKNLQTNQTHKYTWANVILKGTNAIAKDYALLVISNEVAGQTLQLHDTITLVPAYHGVIFDRRLTFPEGKLFSPERITVDMTGEGQTVRQLHYEKGEAKYVDFSGETNTAHWAFKDGLLTFNMLLRIAPLLPRETGKVYTFEAYAEPFLCRIREAEKADGPHTITCEGPEKVTVGKKSYDCVKFRLDLKSAKVKTDVWVDQENRVVKFVDLLPEGAGAKYLEAIIQE